MCSHDEIAIHMARRPYDVPIAQQMHPTYGQTFLQCTDHSRLMTNPTYSQMSQQHTDCIHVTKTNLLPSYATLPS